MSGMSNVKISGMDADQPLKDFATEINKYVTSQNNSNRQKNWAAFWGYVVATLTAAFSAVIELLPRRDNNGRENRKATPNVINETLREAIDPNTSANLEGPKPQGTPIDTDITH